MRALKYHGSCLLWLITVICFLPVPLFAQTEEAQKAALNYLYSGDIKSNEDFEKALTRAKAAGVPAQKCLEAEVVYVVNHGDIVQVKSVFEQMKEASSSWNYKEAQFLNTPDRWKAVEAYFRARIAVQEGDGKEVEAQVKDAFWLNPELGPLLARFIQEYRFVQNMQEVKVSMDTALETAAGKKRTLESLVEGNKALLLDFWASWCGPCKSLMPNLVKEQKTLSKQGVVVVGVNIEPEVVARRQTTQFREQYDIQFPWLLEGGEHPLSRLLEVNSIPRMVLLSPDGKVLYNGHPKGEGLAKALSKMDVNLDAH